MGEILDAFTKAFDTDRPDIIDRLHHAQPLARGPYRRLINDSIIEIERLRALITEWADAGERRANHLRSDNLTESIDKRHYDACEALRKAIER